MDAFLALIGPLVCFGIGGLLCKEGIDAIRWEKATVRGYRITGLCARIVGCAQLLIGIPLTAISLMAIIGM